MSALQRPERLADDHNQYGQSHCWADGMIDDSSECQANSSKCKCCQKHALAGSSVRVQTGEHREPVHEKRRDEQNCDRPR